MYHGVRASVCYRAEQEVQKLNDQTKQYHYCLWKRRKKQKIVNTLIDWILGHPRVDDRRKKKVMIRDGEISESTTDPLR